MGKRIEYMLNEVEVNSSRNDKQQENKFGLKNKTGKKEDAYMHLVVAFTEAIFSYHLF